MYFCSLFKVRGGADETSPLLTTLCHRQDKPVIVTSSGNRMYVHFRSDVSIRGKGFRAFFSSLPQGIALVCEKWMTF